MKKNTIGNLACFAVTAHTQFCGDYFDFWKAPPLLQMQLNLLNAAFYELYPRNWCCRVFCWKACVRKCTCIKWPLYRSIPTYVLCRKRYKAHCRNQMHCSNEMTSLALHESCWTFLGSSSSLHFLNLAMMHLPYTHLSLRLWNPQIRKSGPNLFPVQKFGPSLIIIHTFVCKLYLW